MVYLYLGNSSVTVWVKLIVASSGYHKAVETNVWFGFTTAGHDIPLVHLCPRWSRSCCHCYGEKPTNKYLCRVAGEKILLKFDFAAMCKKMQAKECKTTYLKDANHLSNQVQRGIKRPVFCCSCSVACERIAVNSRGGILAHWKDRVCLPPSFRGAWHVIVLSWKQGEERISDCCKHHSVFS